MTTATATAVTSGRAVSLGTSRSIYDDALRAHEDPTHPCHRFVALQDGVPADHWQLPIPFMGRTLNRGIVFLGFNPSYDPAALDPSWGTSFESFDDFWLRSLDSPSSTWPPLYRRYQEIGERAYGSEFGLGADALVLEVIRYRSAKAHECYYGRQVLDREFPITLKLLTEVAPLAILCSGSDALWALREMLPGLQEILPPDFKITKVEKEGLVYRVEAPWGPLVVIGSRHLVAAFGVTKEAFLALGVRLKEALAS